LRRQLSEVATTRILGALEPRIGTARTPPPQRSRRSAANDSMRLGGALVDDRTLARGCPAAGDAAPDGGH